MTSSESLDGVAGNSRGVAGPIADIAAEGRRIVDAARHCGVPIRLVGGLAIHATLRADRSPLFSREYKDIDLVSARDAGDSAASLLLDLGYSADRAFNLVNGHRRLLFIDEVHQRQVDVFVGVFAMCHEIPLDGRLDGPGDAIPLPELLLTKLQIVELNAKDHQDILNLLASHDLTAAGSPRGIDVSRVARLCANDWGLWRTAVLNLERVGASLDSIAINAATREALACKVAGLTEALESEPKSRKWKLRNRIGDRIRWYEDVDEVA